MNSHIFSHNFDGTDVPEFKGFSTDAYCKLFASEMEDWQLEAYQDVVCKLNRPQLLGLMGTMNSLVWSIACSYGVVEKDKQDPRNRKINTKTLQSLLQKVRTGQAEVRSPISYIREYLIKFWNNGCHAEATLRKFRNMMADLGIFTFEKRGKTQFGGDRLPPMLKSFNLLKILALYELCENVLAGKAALKFKKLFDSEEDETVLPKHCGNFVRRLYNAVFRKIKSFRREEVAAPETTAPTTDVWDDVPKSDRPTAQKFSENAEDLLHPLDGKWEVYT